MRATWEVCVIPSVASELAHPPHSQGSYPGGWIGISGGTFHRTVVSLTHTLYARAEMQVPFTRKMQSG